MTSRKSSAAYRIAFAYTAILALGVALLGLVIFETMHLDFTRQLDATVTDEARTLVSEYHNDGGTELADAIAQREASRSPTRLLYAVFAPDGRRLLGSLDTARPALGLRDIGFIDPREGADAARGLAIDLSPRERLVVAADRESIERADQTVITVFAAGFLAVCLSGLASALLLGAYLRRRLQAISGGAEAIIAGDVRRRMPVSLRQDEFDELAQTLNRMLDRIEGLLDNLRQVSSDVAHDLRTPLARLRNGLEEGLAGAGASAGPVIEDGIRRVDELLSLFGAILRIAEVESGETRKFFAMFDISAMITELADSYFPSVAEGGRTLLWSVEPALIMDGDRDLIAQAAINLIENAQRHTPTGSRIRLTLVSSGAWIYLQIVDNGPGVAKTDRARIVERFTRLDRSRTTEGHGLGLNLVRAVARLHGGQLVLRDADPGLSATMEFPVRSTRHPKIEVEQ